MAGKSLKELMQESLDGYGIEVGTTEPSDPLVKVGINPEGDVSLPIATADTVGGVKIGNGINVDKEGTISVGDITKYGTGAPSSSETAAIYVDSAQVASNNLPQSLYFRIE